MKDSSRILFVFGGLSFIIFSATYFLFGVWMPFLWAFVIGSIVCFAAAIALDWKLYGEFLTLRTTKHGMNMGVLIVLTIAGLICVNYFGVRFNKSIDLTSERLHSLSDQTRKLITALPEDIQVTVFYKGPQALAEKQQIQRVLDLYKDFSHKVKPRYYNTYVDIAAAAEYLNTLSDKDSAKSFAFVDYQKKRIRIAAPFDENQITTALVKATRRADKKIYFVKGHGERDLDSDGPDGLSGFKQALEGQGFVTGTINLFGNAEIPKDAEFLAIVGPKTSYLEPEVQQLREYAKGGGRLLIAVDPGFQHGLVGLIKSFGMEFMNDYVISLNRGGYTPVAVALVFSATDAITKDFPSGQDNVYAVFDVASQLRLAPDLPPGLKPTELVKSSPYSLVVNDLKKTITSNDLPAAKSYTLGMQVQGKYGVDPKARVTETNLIKDKLAEFQAVVYGDSDFLTNQSLFLGINRDLALNTAADLARESDLIGQRAKSFKGTVLDLGRYQQLGVVIGGVGLPLLLLAMSGVMWFRRRGA